MLETAVNDEVEPITARLRGQLMELLEQAQNRTLNNYRALQSMHTPVRTSSHLGPADNLFIAPTDSTRPAELSQIQQNYQINPATQSAIQGFQETLEHHSAEDTSPVNQDPGVEVLEPQILAFDDPLDAFDFDAFFKETPDRHTACQ